MTIQELREHPHLSCSSVSNYMECGLQYKFGRIDCLPAEFTADSLLFGTAVHSVLQSYYQELLTGRKLPLKELLALFEEIWINITEIKDNIQYSNGKDSHTLMLAGKELLSVYYHNLPKEEFTILGIEEPFSFYVDDVPIPVIGVYDLIIEDASGFIIIVDHKTTGRSFSQDEIDKSFQMSVYHLAAQQCGYSGREIILRFDCLIKTKKPRFESLYTSRAEEDNRRTIKQVQTVYEGIRKNVFTPNTNSWRCKTCQFQQACDSWLLDEAA